MNTKHISGSADKLAKELDALIEEGKTIVQVVPCEKGNYVIIYS